MWTTLLTNLHYQIITFQIEEEIVETTEYISADDKESHENTTSRIVTKTGPRVSSHPSMHSVDYILADADPGLNQTENRRSKPVPFPEFGVDFILHHKGR